MAENKEQSFEEAMKKLRANSGEVRGRRCPS